jgi:hypothetical protein
MRSCGISVLLALALSLMAVGCGGGNGGGGNGGQQQQQFTLSSTAFSNNGAIPLKYASANLGGQDVSPLCNGQIHQQGREVLSSPALTWTPITLSTGLSMTFLPTFRVCQKMCPSNLKRK